MIGHYFTMALRGFRRRPGTTLIKILALSLGLSCFITAHGYVNAWEHDFAYAQRVDRVLLIGQTQPQTKSAAPSPERLFSSPPLARHLKADFPDLTAVERYGYLGSFPIRDGDHTSIRSINAADPGYLKMFEARFLAGSADTALSQPFSAVLSEAAAKGMFGTTHVVGRRLVIGKDIDVTVTGVVSGIPQPYDFGTGDLLVTMDVYDKVYNERGVQVSVSTMDSWYSMGFLTFVRLPASGSLTRSRLDQELADYGERYMPEQNLSRFTTIALSQLLIRQLNANYLGNSTDLSITTLFYLFGGLVLVIGCLDFINLSTAEAIQRGWEIGMRKVMGASKTSVAIQSLVEAGLLSLVALLVAFVLVTIFTNSGTLANRASSLAHLVISTYALVMLAVTVVLAGAYPALVITRVRPLRAIRDSARTGWSGAFRAILIGAQFAAASGLLITVAVIYHENIHVRSESLARIEDPTVIIFGGLNNAQVSREVLRTRLLNGPGIKAATILSSPPFVTGSGGGPVSRSSDSTAKTIEIGYQPVGFGYFKTMGLHVIAGRIFSPDRDDTSSLRSVDSPSGTVSTPRGPRTVVLDRRAAEVLGWADPSQAIGKLIYRKLFSSVTEPRPITKPFEVVGVVDGAPPRISADASVGTMYPLATNYAQYPLVRIAKDKVPEALAYIDKTWSELVPKTPINRYFLDGYFDQAFSFYRLVTKMMAGAAAIAAAVAAMGLVGMAVYMVGRRRREIGVRKTLGARTGQILRLLLWDFSKPVLIANLVAWPGAYIASRIYLDTFSSRIGLTAVPFVLSLVATIAIAWVAVGVHAIRAARLKPSAVLRYE